MARRRTHLVQKPKRHSFFISSLGAGGGGVAHVAVAVPPSDAIKRNGSERASERYQCYQHLKGAGNRSPPLARPPPLISPSITVAAENEFNGGRGAREGEVIGRLVLIL